MKNVLRSICFTAVAIVFANARNYYACNGIDLKHPLFMNMFSIVPQLRSHKCMYDCMLDAAGMVTPDGMIMEENFIDYLHISSEYDDSTILKIEEAIHKCKDSRDLSEGKIADSCDNVGALVLCSVNEGEKIGLDIRTMLAALRLPFLQKPIVWVN